jgi:hypothetical protein
MLASSGIAALMSPYPTVCVPRNTSSSLQLVRPVDDGMVLVWLGRISGAQAELTAS